MYQLAHIANTILYRANAEDVDISPMKLQKLIYFLYAEHLCTTDEALFSERFEPWRYGPVLDDIYQAFRAYGAKSIHRYMPDAMGNLRMIDLEKDMEFRSSFDNMWRKYSPLSGIELSKLTHKKNGAWYNAIIKNQYFLSDDDIKKEAEEKTDA